MRALRSRTVKSDSGSEDPKKPQRKSKKNSKRKSENQSTSDNDTLEEPPKRVTRKSMSSKETKENVSPNVKKQSRKSKKKSRRNKSKDKSTETDESQNNSILETTFKNVVTSTTMKPKRPKKSKTPEKTEDLLNTTYLKIDDEPSIPKTTNNSGQWKIEEKSVINISDDSMMKTSPIETRKVVFNESITRSTRKKWQCFARNSQGANSILEQIGTPKKKSPINTTRKSTNKIKRTVMPNFALIHQKAFDKMESISDYSQRKKERALLLTSSSKKNTTVETSSNVSKVKSSRQLFSNEGNGNNTNTNRFGFKPLTKPAIKPPVKPSLYERNDVISIANKKPQTTNKRDTKRDALKGVRTNRRFELLMKMRNTK